MEKRVRWIVGVLFFVFISFSLFGCATAWSDKIGSNRYEIKAQPGLLLNSNANFSSEAKRVCPNGYKVAERYTSGKYVYGTVECE